MKYRGFNTPTRLLLWGLFLAAVTAALWATGGAAIATVGHWMDQERDRLPWYATRLFALLAYLAITASVLYGLLLSTGILDAFAHRTVSFTLHQDLAAVGLGLALMHAALLTLDSSVPYTLTDIFVPFVGPFRPVWVGIGQVSLYLTVVVYFSFNARRRMGQRAWRMLHYLTFIVFLGATAHGLMAGTDTAAPWAFWGYVAASTSVVFLFVYRVLTAISARGAKDAAGVRRELPARPVPGANGERVLPTRPLPARPLPERLAAPRALSSVPPASSAEQRSEEDGSAA